jgi:hypothetical protein
VVGGHRRGSVLLRRLGLAPALVAACPLLGGCGELVVDGDYPGTPLAQIDGTVMGATDGLIGRPRIAVIWLLLNDFRLFDTAQIEPVFPASFQFRLYAPPRDADIQPPDGVQPVGNFPAVLGELVAFDDRDGDGSLVLDGDGQVTAPDVLIGRTRRRLLYVVELPTDETPVFAAGVLQNPEDVAQGYQLADVTCVAGAGCEVWIAWDEAVDVKLTAAHRDFFCWNAESPEPDQCGPGSGG